MASDGAGRWLLSALRLWLRCVAHPVATLNALLAVPTRDAQLSETIKLWAPAVLIGVAISLATLAHDGVGWGNAALHLLYEMAVLPSLLVTAAVSHQLLRWRKLRSDFVPTLVMYTVAVVSYSPLIRLSMIPATLRIFDTAQAIERDHLSLAAALTVFLHQRHETGTPGMLIAAIGVLASVVSFGCLALFAEAVSQWYGNSRTASYSTVAAASLLSALVAVLIFGPLLLLIVYALAGPA